MWSDETRDRMHLLCYLVAHTKTKTKVFLTTFWVAFICELEFRNHKFLVAYILTIRILLKWDKFIN